MTSDVSTAPEYQLADAMFEICARVQPRGKAGPSVVNAGPVPLALVALTERHGLAGVIFEQLLLERTSFEPGVREAFEAAAQRTAGHSLRLQKLTRRVHLALNECGIIPLALKGAGVAARYYPNELSRVSSDVDVLVGPGDVSLALKALAALGYLPQERAWVKDTLVDHHEIALHGPQGLVELHTQLFQGVGRGRLTAEQVLPRAVAGELHGAQVLFLNHEDEVLYLLVHAAKSAFKRAAWLLDCMLAIRARPPDWALMKTRAQQTHLQAAWQSALAVLEGTLGPGIVPAEVLPRFGRRQLMQRLWSRQRIAAAHLSEDRLGAFATRLLLTDSVFDATLQLGAGVKRAVRTLRSRL